MKYKIIFSDIDGTIINDFQQVTLKTRQILQQLNQPVILVSARMPSGIRVVQEQFDNHDPIICYSGALILKENEILYDQGIDALKARTLYQILCQEPVSVSAYCYDRWYCHNDDDWIRQEEDITQLKAIVSDFSQEKKVHKFLCMGDPEQIRKLEAKLKQQYPDLSIYRSKPTYLEIMNGQVSKLKAIEALLADYHLSLSDCVSFGDNYNDLDMLEHTGMAFAMANAPQDIKDHIGSTTLSNNEDGVAYAIENLL